MDYEQATDLLERHARRITAEEGGDWDVDYDNECFRKNNDVSQDWEDEVDYIKGDPNNGFSMRELRPDDEYIERLEEAVELLKDRGSSTKPSQFKEGRTVQTRSNIKTLLKGM